MSAYSGTCRAKGAWRGMQVREGSLQVGRTHEQYSGSTVAVQGRAVQGRQGMRGEDGQA